MNKRSFTIGVFCLIIVTTGLAVHIYQMKYATSDTKKSNRQQSVKKITKKKTEAKQSLNSTSRSELLAEKKLVFNLDDPKLESTKDWPIILESISHYHIQFKLAQSLGIDSYGDENVYESLHLLKKKDTSLINSLHKMLLGNIKNNSLENLRRFVSNNLDALQTRNALYLLLLTQFDEEQHDWCKNEILSLRDRITSRLLSNDKYQAKASFVPSLNFLEEVEERWNISAERYNKYRDVVVFNVDRTKLLLSLKASIEKLDSFGWLTDADKSLLYPGIFPFIPEKDKEQYYEQILSNFAPEKKSLFQADCLVYATIKLNGLMYLKKKLTPKEFDKHHASLISIPPEAINILLYYQDFKYNFDEYVSASELVIGKNQDIEHKKFIEEIKFLSCIRDVKRLSGSTYIAKLNSTSEEDCLSSYTKIRNIESVSFLNRVTKTDQYFRFDWNEVSLPKSMFFYDENVRLLQFSERVTFEKRDTQKTINHALFSEGKILDWSEVKVLNKNSKRKRHYKIHVPGKIRTLESESFYKVLRETGTKQIELRNVSFGSAFDQSVKTENIFHSMILVDLDTKKLPKTFLDKWEILNMGFHLDIQGKTLFIVSGVSAEAFKVLLIGSLITHNIDVEKIFNSYQSL